MKISGVDIRPGNIIEYEGGIWRAVKIQHTQPGKGGAYMQVELKNLIDGRKNNVRFRSAETVERLFQSQAGGNTIYVRSNDRRTIHYYAHLDAYAPGLEEGKRVSRGELLGTVGSSGNASPDAPHLHFAILRTTPDAEWWEPATAINPYPLLKGAE